MECTNFAEIITIVTSAVAILGAIITTYVFLYREMKVIENRMLEESRLLTAKSDKQFELYSSRTDQMVQSQVARSDALYQMFIDLLKEKKN